MPKIALNEPLYRKRDFLAEVERCKVLKGIGSDRQLAERLGLCPSGLSVRKKDPEKLTVKELLVWKKELGLPMEAVMKFLGYKV